MGVWRKKKMARNQGLGEDVFILRKISKSTLCYVLSSMKSSQYIF